MTLPRLAAMYRRWEQSPPLCVSVVAIAQAFGFKTKKADKGNAEELAATLGAAGFKSEKPAWLMEAEKATTST